MLSINVALACVILVGLVIVGISELAKALLPTPYNEYLLYVQSIYSMQQVLTQYNTYLLYATGTYSIQRVLTPCNE